MHAEEQLGLTLPYVAVAWIEKRSVELREKLKPVPAVAAAGELVDTSFDEVGLKVHPSAASSATALRRRTGALVLMPRTRITDLLAKLISLTGFAGRCVHFRTGGAAANLAILLAEATNISLEQMTW